MVHDILQHSTTTVAYVVVSEPSQATSLGRWFALRLPQKDSLWDMFCIFLMLHSELTF